MEEKHIYKEINDLFQTRDKAIQQKDKDLLASTQLDTTRVYIPRCTKFSSEIITVVDDDKEGINKVAFVRERQSFKDYGYNDETFEADQVRYRIFQLVNTMLGWRIARDF